MVQKRKQHSDEFKAKAALEAIKGIRTAGQLSSVFGIHPTQIANWKRQLVEGAPRIFSNTYGNSGKTEKKKTKKQGG